MTILDFQENIDALCQYWHRELNSAKYRIWNDEGWIRCHPEVDIASRKGFIRGLRIELKKRKRRIEVSQKRIAFVEAMLREIEFEVGEVNERLFPTN